MWIWLLNPKNLLLALLLVAVLCLGGYVLIQRANNAIMQSQVTELKTANINQGLQIKAYQENAEALKKLGTKMESVRKETSRNAGAIEDLKFGGVENEKTILFYNALITDFMRGPGAKTGGKDLPQAAKTNTAKAGPK